MTDTTPAQSPAQFTVASANEYYGRRAGDRPLDFSKIEAIKEAHDRLAIANKEFMRAAQELLAARAMGGDQEGAFSALEVMYVVKARAEREFQAAHA